MQRSIAAYQDDGFTGLNMERPDLQRMLRAIERRQINLVITKDLSRLGRNYLQTGHLIEYFTGTGLPRCFPGIQSGISLTILSAS